jgi:hypothetical protein
VTTRADVVATVRGLLDTPYRHGGRLPGIGIDCLGIAVVSALILCIPEAKAFSADAEFAGYSRQPDPAKLFAACDRYLDRIQAPELAALAVMRFEREPQHFGVISSLEPLRMIHAYQQVGRVAEHGIDVKWKRRILRYYRFRGLE